MGSTVSIARIALNESYVRLRIKIMDHYHALSLVGVEVGAKAYKLPPKLGHWNADHSARVRAASPYLENVVAAIDRLASQRDAGIIAAKHIRRKPGGRGGARSNLQQTPVLMGEWPPRK
jgi:hypothetical protein